MRELSLPDWTKRGDVKAFIKDLVGESGMVHEPSTAATPRMMACLLGRGGLVDRERKSSLLSARDALQIVLEGVGGCRVGEVAGGGDVHGFLANNLSLVEDPTADAGTMGATVVEGWLEHSKTGFGRFLDIAGVTQSTGIECAEALRRYWRETGVRLTTSQQAGMRVTRPDAWVLRVSLLGLTAEAFETLRGCMRRSTHTCVQNYTKSTLPDMETRMKSTGAGSQDKKYMNVAMGSSVDPGMAAFVAELKAHGVDARWLPAPLLLASTGGAKWPTLKTTGLAVGTSAENITKLLKLAHLTVHKGGGVDPDLDVEIGREPKWTSHSLRRGADTAAKRHQEESGASDASIDLFFGWQERVLLKAMQTHYMSLSIRERVKHARITGFM